MKKSVLILFFFLTNSVFSQQGGQKFYSPEFKWTIILPEGLEEMDDVEGKVLEAKGLKYIEKAYNTEFENLQPTKNIVTLKKGVANMFEVNMQIFDPSVDNYENSLKNVWEVMHTTIKSIAPGAEVKSENTIEIISGLKFYKNTIILSLPGNMKLYSHMYSRLFGKKDFNLNIMYINETLGKVMIESWKSSLFN